MNLNNIPNDVLWVWALNWSKSPVGSDTYKEVQRIIDENPKYFIQEHIYRTIPQEVKDSFNAEKISLYSKFYPPILTDREEGEGMVSWLNRQPVPVITKESLEKTLNYVFVEKPQKDKEYKRELEKLHNKHYGKYGYKYEK